MRLLVLCKARNPDVGVAFRLVADDLAGLGKCREEVFHVDRVRREDRHLDPLRAILEAPLPVGHRPQPDEQPPGRYGQLREVLVRVDRRLDVSRARHYSPLIVRQQMPQKYLKHADS